MDISPIHSQEAASLSTCSNAESSTTTQPLRSSARVRAAKAKATNSYSNEEAFSECSKLSRSSDLAESVSNRITRSYQAKPPQIYKDEQFEGPNRAHQRSFDFLTSTTSRSSQLTRARRVTFPTAWNTGITINEPQPDLKGKKRAFSETQSDSERLPIASSKRKRTTSTYSLRSQAKKPVVTDSKMPRKTRSVSGKGKLGGKNKSFNATASTSRQGAEDSDDTENQNVVLASPEPIPADDDRLDSVDAPDGDDDRNDRMDEKIDANPGESEPASTIDSGSRGFGGFDETTALAMFGNYRQFGSYMVSLGGRLKTMLENIKMSAEPTIRMVTLQELSELLSISTEDTLAGSLQVEQFVSALVTILGGKEVSPEDDEEAEDRDEDVAVAATLALSSSGTFQGDENPEAQVLACRCLANLMEALPGVAHTVVYHGAIPVLCSKLIEISYIDLAEQTMSTLQKISEEFPSSIVREGGLAALLNYLDFFSIAVQRTALQAASNCCRNMSSEHFSMLLEVWPIIRNCLGYSDQRLVEFAAICVIRTIDSYHRASVDNLEKLVDQDLVRAINALLIPANGSPLIAPNTFTLILRAMATAARASPQITVALLEADAVDTLHQILTGVLPSQREELDQDGAGGEHGTASMADLAVMDNLAHRPKDQVEEALSLVSELMPPLPKDGVFDHKAYTEKGLARLIKAKAKADRMAARQSLFSASVTNPDRPSQHVMSPQSEQMGEDIDLRESAMAESNDGDKRIDSSAPTSAVDRTELLRSKIAVVSRFFQLMVPVLVEVYAASVVTPVRVKTLTGLLKAVSFLQANGVKRVLYHVPVASFASSILSSKDHPSLVIAALQLTDLLLIKLPSEYRSSFQREGVFYEINLLADRILIAGKSKEKDGDVSLDSPSAGESPNSAVPVTINSSASMMPGYRKLAQLSLDPEDAITLRARVIRFKHLEGAAKSDENTAYTALRDIVDTLIDSKATEIAARNALQKLADLFVGSHSSMSSFELMQSGLVDSLLRFSVDSNRSLSLERRTSLFMNIFTATRRKPHSASQTPLATLVKKLQESLTRLEPFHVFTVAQSDDSKRSSPSLLARQLRLRLVADEDSDIPKNLHNIVVSIHAIATFQALHDYLRPRVAGVMSSSGSRLSGMLAALAASALAASGSRPPIPESAQSSSALTIGTNINSSGSTADSALSRRRSTRLNAKSGGNSDGTDGSFRPIPTDQGVKPPLPLAAEAFAAMYEQVMAANDDATMNDEEFHEDEVDHDDVDAEVFEGGGEDLEEDASGEKTVTLSIIDDGLKVEAQTPDGTRVATPNLPTSPSTPRNPKSSYANILKTQPSDWHLQFSMDDTVLPLDLTIYGAIHQNELRRNAGTAPLGLIWQGVYTVKFKKVAGPLILPGRRAEELSQKMRSPSPSSSLIVDEAPHAKTLRLLRVLYKLNIMQDEQASIRGHSRGVPASLFVNNKLTAKLTRQLEEPMIVASSCLPDWAIDLPQHYPFLFPFATRYSFLQSTAFGYARLILKWQSQQSRPSDNSRRDDSIAFLGRLQRQKVRISRKHILESAVKVFELYGSSSSILEVEYFEEVGTGLGPTLEFYSLVSREFARRDLKVWRDQDSSYPGSYVHHPTGLFPAPMGPDLSTDGAQKRLQIFRVVGQFIAKAMLDSRIIDLSFNKTFVKLILGVEIPLTLASLQLVDSDLAKSLWKIREYADASSLGKGKIALQDVADLALDFTIPGYDIELRPGGQELLVTSSNVEEYVREVLDAILGQGIKAQVQAFREGFSKVFPVTDLHAFSAEELVMLFGNTEEDWSVDTLTEAIKADHGFNAESRSIRQLVDLMASYDQVTRRAYLQFITGSPKLPIGGFRGLNPPLTVVRKPHETPLKADDYLPSVMTCANYLKLPSYSSIDVMRERLSTAFKEGVGSFHLS